MNKISEVTVEVNAKMVVDERTAHFCLMMVEKYVNDTGALIVVDTRKDGTIAYNFKEQK